MSASAAATRLVGLTVLWVGVELLERTAYRAGVERAAAAAAGVLDDLADNLEAADLSDVLAAHAECCGTEAGER